MTTEQATTRAFTIARLHGAGVVDSRAAIVSLATIASHPNARVGALCQRLADAIQPGPLYPVAAACDGEGEWPEFAR